MVAPRDSKVMHLVRHHWDARAATFDDEPGHGLHSQEQREAWHAVLTRLTGGASQRVLDVGCGTGFLALMFAELGHSVTGIDLAPQMLTLARQKARQAQLTVQFRLENAASLSDPNGSYDLVVARHVIWTLPDPAQAVGEWLRVLRSGGRLVLIEGNWSTNEIKTGSASSTGTALALMRAASRSIYRGARRVARKRTPAALMRAVLTVICHYASKEQWAFSLRKLYDWSYQQIHTELPFFGGPPAERLVAFLEAQGLRDVIMEPLMRPALWGEVPPHPRYLAMGSRG